MKRKTPFTKLLRVQLSEPVVENAVQLNCLQQTSSGITASVGSIRIKKGFSSQTISVQINSFGNGDPTALSCVAQSIGGSQYKFNNSQGDGWYFFNISRINTGQSTLLIPTDGKVWLYPQTAYYTGVSFEASFIVNL
ncbi:hypothetical protein PHET_03693 [Paragonimus heterotremus]|uniref:Uncharacterized protein n=1 Tax=Paragonimus heterotremus TaxID=100268 RepID=A0A8J4TG95_9TREM|nr:hypothetical protein PHET_03693 [Paragonimus heterotremus]